MRPGETVAEYRQRLEKTMEWQHQRHHYVPPAPETLEEKIRALSRIKIVRLLEEVACIQCYDEESLETLAEALKVNVEDDTIDIAFIDEALLE